MWLWEGRSVNEDHGESSELIGQSPSPDPVAAVAGDGAHAAALLDDHVDVGLYDLGDLAGLRGQTGSPPVSSKCLQINTYHLIEIYF